VSPGHAAEGLLKWVGQHDAATNLGLSCDVVEGQENWARAEDLGPMSDSAIGWLGDLD
jgi:hypothetical protein